MYRFRTQITISLLVGLCGSVCADPLEIGTKTVPIQLSGDFQVKFGRSDAPLAALRTGSGDSHLSSADNYHYYQLGLQAAAQYRDFSADVDFLATGAPTDWVDSFTKRDYWVREAALRWKAPRGLGTVSIGRLRYDDFGLGLDANGDLLPATAVRLDSSYQGVDFSFITGNVPPESSIHPHFTQLFGGYPSPSQKDAFAVYRASKSFEGPVADTTLGATLARPSVLMGRRQSVDLTSTLKDGRQVQAIYQTTPRNIFGQSRGDDSLFLLTGDVVKNERWQVRAGWSQTGDNYAVGLNSSLFPFGASYDELVFDRPLFVGAPIPTDSATAPSAVAPDYGLLMDAIELDVRYALTPTAAVRVRYMRGDQQNGVGLGDIWYLSYKKDLGMGLAGEIGYGHVHADDPFRVGAPSYHTLRFALHLDNVLGLVSDYAKESGLAHKS